MSVNLAEQLGSISLSNLGRVGDCHFAPSSASCFNCRSDCSAGRWTAPLAMDRSLPPSPQQQTNGANATSRKGRRSGNGGESLRCLMLVSSYSSCVRWIVAGPLFFVFFSAPLPTLQLPKLSNSSLVVRILCSSVFSRPISMIRIRPPTITVSLTAPSFDKVRRRFHASVPARDKNNWPNTAQRCDC